MTNISSECYQGALTIIRFLVIFFVTASKLEKIGPIFSSFNPFPSLSSVATDDRKQFQCRKIVFSNQTRPLFFVIQLMGRHHLAFIKYILSSFNPFPSLPSAATDVRKQFQCRKIVFSNQTRPLFFVIQLMGRHHLAFIKYIFSSFNPFPSLPSAATDVRKHFQCRKIVFNNKTRPLFLEFN